jgi:hypothetical protein
MNLSCAALLCLLEGFTGLSLTMIAIITLAVRMQVTGRIRWSERLLAGAWALLPSIGIR